MNNIQAAIRELHRMEAEAAKDRWLNRIHPLSKFLLSLCYTAVVLSFPRYDLSGLAVMAVYPAGLILAAELSVVDAWRRLKYLLLLLAAVGLFNPFLDRAVLFSIGTFEVTGGMISFLTLLLKGILSVLSVYLLAVTTPMERICYALRLLHVPKLFVTIVLLIYRYLIVLLKETDRMMQAYALRAPGQKGIRMKAWGTLAGMLLLKSIDRAEDVYDSMQLRGYRGEYAGSSQSTGRTLSLLYFGGWAAFLFVCRFVPVLERLGACFLCMQF